MARFTRIVAPAVLIATALAALTVGLLVGGGAAEQPIADPGDTVRWGLPVVTVLLNLSVAGTLGALALAAFALSPSPRRGAAGEFDRALDIAAGSAAVWTVAAATSAFFTFMTIYLEPITFDDRFGQLLARFLTTTELGKSWLWAVLIAAVVTVLCFAVRNRTVLLFVTALAMAGVVQLSSQGHAGGTADHDAAVTALWMHMVGAAVWLGGLLTIVLLKKNLGHTRLLVVLERYSSLALVCFVVVAASGYVSAEIRVGQLENLATPYGLLVLAKVAALVALGAFGAFQRQFLIRRMSASAEPGRGLFWWMVTAELAFMGVASGVAAALGRTAPPQAEIVVAETAAPTPAELLTGKPLPAPIEPSTWFTAWNLDPLWSLVCGFLAFFYLAGVWRLRRRGDRWPVYRTVLWLVGVAVLFYVTCGPMNVYQDYLFSVHMLAHMMLTMLIPVLLVPGAPVTLALRTIERRTDGSRGAREWIMLAVHSRYMRVLTNPIVAAIIFAGSLWLFYFTPLFSWAVTDHVGHYWMLVHFLASGYLFALVLIGTDPIPYRAPYPARLMVLLATMAFHAFFGLAIMSSEGLLLADWYGAMGWGTDALADQRVGGGIAWSVGEIPTVALAIIVAIMWSRSDAKESKRKDRQEDRSGDAELAAYNAMLAAQAERDTTAR
ncbi:cytochrome c oxidase assembly protein [Diaminobutyricimonas sp. LJ205]|uniref:cytochrome c oxidase assembly protein n=1 Tax=Diaminobutyricimonas sp. LJ205 TaxID=2683590 RepID=UPI0018DF124C|nr:cytochrome c oxidase assembly protein [Diaminobutyricimonas sp. LJ205]